jgi:CarD family transcriptional regulator
MPSTERAAKSRKTTTSAKSRVKSPKTASKAAASGEKSVRAKGGSDHTKAAAKGVSTAVSKATTKSPGRLAVKIAAKKAAAEKTISSKSPVAKNSRATEAKAVSSKGAVTKNKAAVAASKGSASTSGALKAASKSNRNGTEAEARPVSKRSVASSVSAKHVVLAAPTGTATKKNSSTLTAAKDQPKTAPAKTVSVKKNQEKDIQRIRPQDTHAINPVVDSPAQAVGVKSLATASTTPAASEPIQVAKNISETAAKAAAPKSIQPVAMTSSSEVNAVAAKVAQPVAQVAKPRPASQKLGFKMSEFIVYPAHGVGQIMGIEVQEVAGFSLELFVVSFIKDKMILKVPTSKVVTVGMRKLAELEVVEKALGTLSGRARIKRTMWSRRAQEYEAKINSGDLVTIAEVVRDLYRSDTQPEQSYSERQLYEAALDRMAREIAAVRKLIDSEALKLIESFLLKGPRRGAKLEVDLIVEADDADVDRAA